MSEQSPAVLQATLDSLSAHIAILDGEGNIIAINSAWRRFAGSNGFRGADCGLGSNYLSVCQAATGADADEAPLVVEGIEDVLSGARDEFYLEYPCHSPQELRWFSLRATRFWNEESESPSRVVVSHENISARKIAELRLREEVEITETLYHVGQVVAGELDLSEVIRVVTEAAVDLCDAGFGCFVPSPDSALGLPSALNNAPDSLDEEALLELIEQEFDAILRARPLLSSCIDGNCCPADLQARLEEQNVATSLASPVVTRSGEKMGILLVASSQHNGLGTESERIISALAGQAALALENARLYERARREQIAAAQSEQRYRFVTEMMPQIVWVTRPDGHHEYYNSRWYDYTGQTEGHSLGDGWANPLHPDDVERSQRRWEHSLQTGELYEIEYRFRRFDGIYRWFLGRAAPQRDENGKILRWFGTCTDIDDQKRAETERVAALEREAKARQDAESANRLKDEFLAIVSHELRTPLTPIMGWIEMLRDSDTEAAFREQAYDVIERNARAQSQIINDLLDVSRIITGKMRLDTRVLDLNRVLFAAIQTCESAAIAKGVEIVRELPGEPTLMTGDADRLQQIAWNLISNAIKFTPREGRVMVKLERGDSALRICIEDTGAGIDPNFLPHVFERFRQADASPTRRYGGLGLGLSIVRHLVEQHGGEVSVDSKGKNTGSKFYVRLPIAPVMPEGAEDDWKRDDMPRVARVRHDALKNLRILVVDDEADAREVLAQMLRRFGAQVETAASAAFAIERFKVNVPDVMVSDIGMPGGDGYSLVRRLREFPSEAGGRVPALALTAYARAEDRARALESGFGAYLAKPVSPDQLVATIRALAKPKSH
ncbi:sensory/regulatory protein RpfC [Abditibacteriota bacterium]|nr:sensory/regulatory protein RpfC [Abditibacteriota bacterium]